MKNIKRISILFLILLLCALCSSVSSAQEKEKPDNVEYFYQVYASTDSVDVEWSETKGAYCYKLYIYNSCTEEYELFKTCKGTSCTVDSLDANGLYKLRIKAVSKVDGVKYYSKKYTYLKVVTTPGKIKSISCTGQKSDSFCLKWSKMSNITGYQIFRLNIETDEWELVKNTEASSVRLKTKGKYKVRAYTVFDANVFYGAFSKSLSCTFLRKPSTKGTFTFTVYGYGHGVGMSQYGAIGFADEGWSYSDILTHYYTGTTVVTDKNPPKKVTYNGKKYSLTEYLRRTVQAELGGTDKKEALKAQVVACYSYAKYKGFKLTSSDHAFSSASAVCANVRSAVKAVKGKYVCYKKKVCMTPYSCMCAGTTTSSKITWGGSLPYLSGGAYSPYDKKCDGYKTKVNISSTSLKKKVKEAYGITLKGDPADWLEIISHDSAVSKGIGYVIKIKVGSKKVTGNSFKSNIFGSKMRSHCFTFTYTPKD